MEHAASNASATSGSSRKVTAQRVASAASGRSSRVTSVDDRDEVHGHELGGQRGHDTQALEDRVDGLVDAVDLGQGLALPARCLGIGGRAGLAAQQLDVGAHDRERRPQGVRHDRHEVGPGLVDGAQRLDLRLAASAWRRLFSTSAARRPASVSRKRRLAGENSRGSTVWTLRTPTTCSSQTSGTEHHRREARLVDAADPGEARVVVDVRADDRAARLGGDARDALAHGQASHADGVVVEAVRRREGHAAAVAVGEVERADVGARGSLGARR